MAQFDVFNGDADGICALHQLRLAAPCDSELVTGVKRDINLLERVTAGAGDRVTVLDVSLDKNRAGLERLLAAGAEVEYFDHHYAGEIPDHPELRAHIDTSPEVCTALLVNAELEGRFLPWAVVAAFGDNLDAVAQRAAAPLKLEAQQLDTLRHLGVCLNYNSYGVDLDDLFFAPDALYRQLQPYADPFAFIAEGAAFLTLSEGYSDDMARARETRPELDAGDCALFILPDEKWARRVGGVFGNELAQQHPERAHAMLTRLDGGGFRVSVRAPLATKTGADALCRQFPSGGGRQGAAGINLLPETQYDEFVARFCAVFAR